MANSSNHAISSEPVDANGDTSPPNVNLEQLFTLVDGILPFEACLYYQVLPLSIAGSRLNLGMVNPGDQTATEYVRRLVSYINYSIVTSQISSDWHRDILSKYLSHAAKAKQRKAATQAITKKETVTSHPADHPPHRPTANLQETLVVDTPDEIEEAAPSQPSSSTQPTVPVAESSVAVPHQPSPSEVPSSRQSPLELDIPRKYIGISPEDLKRLPPKELTQALLGHILAEGIGRLFFERRSSNGRILWSKDGVVQAALESVHPNLFQGVINEIKRLTHLSLIPLSKPKQVEIERLFRQERVLLRFRVMPGNHGEEATLQVLRGAALRFHQQQQIDTLGRDALSLAQTLQVRLNELRDKARQSLNPSSPNTIQTETLPALINLLKRMEDQIDELIHYEPSRD
jgi:type II secretory ATPase GspE/PulE/Tfp pilus assembly ATPase PilB-like protein